jgi:hypothetical protein
VESTSPVGQFSESYDSQSDGASDVATLPAEMVGEFGRRCVVRSLRRSGFIGIGPFTFTEFTEESRASEACRFQADNSGGQRQFHLLW